MSNKSQLKDNNSLLNTILGIVSNKQNKEVTAETEANTGAILLRGTYRKYSYKLYYL